MDLSAVTTLEETSSVQANCTAETTTLLPSMFDADGLLFFLFSSTGTRGQESGRIIIFRSYIQCTDRVRGGPTKKNRLCLCRMI